MAQFNGSIISFKKWRIEQSVDFFQYLCSEMNLKSVESLMKSKKTKTAFCYFEVLVKPIFHSSKTNTKYDASTCAHLAILSALPLTLSHHLPALSSVASE